MPATDLDSFILSERSKNTNRFRFIYLQNGAKIQIDLDSFKPSEWSKNTNKFRFILSEWSKNTNRFRFI